MSVKPWFSTWTIAVLAGSGPASGVRFPQAVKAATRRTGDARMKAGMGLTGEDVDSRPVVVRYREELRDAFERLNRDWIETYFTLEPADRELLGDPQRNILDPGGQVFFILDQGEGQGTCAVVRHNAVQCEIAKMAVARAARGRGYGDLLMECSLAFAREIGSRRVVIVSNTVLAPAI